MRAFGEHAFTLIPALGLDKKGLSLASLRWISHLLPSLGWSFLSNDVEVGAETTIDSSYHCEKR